MAVALSIASVLVFLLTQDLSLPFGWIVDKWTILHIALLAIEFITIYICIKEKKHSKQQHSPNKQHIKIGKQQLLFFFSLSFLNLSVTNKIAPQKIHKY
jgi:hypothetical protein